MEHPTLLRPEIHHEISDVTSHALVRVLYTRTKPLTKGYCFSPQPCQIEAIRSTRHTREGKKGTCCVSRAVTIINVKNTYFDFFFFFIYLNLLFLNILTD